MCNIVIVMAVMATVALSCFPGNSDGSKIRSYIPSVTDDNEDYRDYSGSTFDLGSSDDEDDNEDNTEYSGSGSGATFTTRSSGACPSYIPIRCNASLNTCISSYRLCNGFRDCPDGEDERNCPARACPSYIPIRCNASINTCISIYHLCNGRRDCPEGEDERNCPAHDSTTNSALALRTEESNTTFTTPSISKESSTTLKAPSITLESTSTLKTPSISRGSTTTLETSSITTESTTTLKTPSNTEESFTNLTTPSVTKESTTNLDVLAITEDSVKSVNMTVYKGQVQKGVSTISNNKIWILCLTCASLLLNVILIYKCCKRRARKSSDEASKNYTRAVSDDKQNILVY